MAAPFDFMRLRTDTSYRLELTDWLAEDDALKEAGRELCKTNLLCLCYVLGYTKIDPVVHKEAIEFFLPRNLAKPVSEQGIGQMTRGTLLYPRGTFKTTLDEADVVQETICFPRDATTFIVCANMKLATALVANIAAHFIKPRQARPTLFQALFPEMCVLPSQWSSASGFSPATRQASPPIKEDAVMAFSCESGNSGWHCWRMKGDDLANNRNMRSETSRADVVRNYNINRKMLMPGGIEDKMGTRYAPDDPYGVELSRARLGSYRYVVKPALRLKNGERLDANGFPARQDVELLFEPLGLTWEFLRDEYDSDYSAFMTQYMNDDAGDNEVVFSQDEMLKVLCDDEQMPLAGQVVMHVRLPSKAHGWRTAAAVVGSIENNRLYIIDAMHGSYKPTLLARRIVDLARKWELHSVEVQQAPGAEKLGALASNYALTLGYPLNLVWIEPQGDETEMDGRIKALEGLFRGGRLLFTRDLPPIRRLIEQFVGYGMVSDTSLPDVVAHAAEHLPQSIGSTATVDSLAYAMASERDMYNTVYGAGPYAPVQPEPEETEVDVIEDWRNPFGLEDMMPGLSG